MVQLGNQRDNSDDAKNEFQKFVLENLDSFDLQAWNMFCNRLTIRNVWDLEAVTYPTTPN